MADPLQKVSAGDGFSMPASTFNTMIDAARQVKSQQNNVGRRADLRPNPLGSIWVKNSSGEARSRFDVLCVDQPLFGPDENLDEFKSGPVMNCIMPAAAKRGKFIVLQEPVGDGKIARATVSGMSLVRVQVDVDLPDIRFAEIADGVATNLVSTASGAAAIIWRQVGTGLKWAWIRLGNFTDPAPMPVTLTQTGGSQGSASSAATWTYSVASLAGQVLGTNISPVTAPHKFRRPSVGYMLPATFGYAQFDSSGVLALGWINEVADQEACS